MNKQVLLITLVFILFASCNLFDDLLSKFNSKTEGEIILEEEISTAGGILKTDSIEIIIPEGAFSLTHKVQVVELSPDSIPIEGAITKYYKLVGITEELLKPIIIRVLTDMAVAKDEIPVFMSETYLKLNESEYSRTPVFAVDSGDWIVAELTFDYFSENPEQGALFKSSAGSYEYSWFALTALKHSSEHFDIYYEKKDGLEKINKVAATLEDGIDKFKAMGFSFDIKKGEVYVWKIKDDGGVSQSWKTGKIHMEINNALLKNEKELNVTIGHELFHWVQYSYDQAFWSGLKNVWLNEAFAVWSESLFAPPTHVPQVLQANRFEPCQGLQAGAERISGELGSANDLKTNHGYGSASLIRYMVRKHGNSYPHKVYQEIQNGAHPVYALHKASNYQLASDWGLYVNDMMQNKIYPYANEFYTQALLNLTDDLEIASADTSFVFKESYADLSAKFYQIKLQQAFKKNAVDLQLKFKVDQNNLTNMETIAVYKLNEQKQIELLGTTKDSIVVGNFSDAYYLFAVVINSNFSNSPKAYNNTKDIELSIETVGEPAGCNGGMVFDCIMQLNTSDGIVNDSLTDFFLLFPYIKGAYETSDGIQLEFGIAEGEFIGSVFKSEWDVTNQIGTSGNYNDENGFMMVKMNNAKTSIDEMVWADTTIQHTSMGVISYINNIKLKNIPLVNEQNNEFTYSVNGSSVSSSIDQIKYNETYINGTRHLVSYSTSANSSISVIFKGAKIK